MNKIQGMSKTEKYEIIYPTETKKYTGAISERGNSFRCVIGRGKPFYNSSTHKTYELAFEYMKNYNITNNLTIRNLIYKYVDRIEVSIIHNGKEYFSIFDISDIDTIQKYVLNISKCCGGYLAVRAGLQEHENKAISHILLGFKYDETNKITIDHINRNPFDNRRKNLRPSNLYVQGNNKDRILNAAGITDDTIDCRWIARIGSGENSRKKSFSYKPTYSLAFSYDYACALAYFTRKKWEGERDEKIEEITENLTNKMIDIKIQ